MEHRVGDKVIFVYGTKQKGEIVGFEIGLYRFLIKVNKNIWKIKSDMAFLNLTAKEREQFQKKFVGYLK